MHLLGISVEGDKSLFSKFLSTSFVSTDNVFKDLSFFVIQNSYVDARVLLSEFTLYSAIWVLRWSDKSSVPITSMGPNKSIG